ncbi:MAG TPA: glycoside hydrolase family 43 protein [Patescibacteria group bacterium]|nr:glycoside hydrolase family 43 protein [Patescibacteria group bacterium]
MLIALIFGCGSTGQSGVPGSASAASETPAAAPSTLASGSADAGPSASPMASLAAGMFRNPVIDADFPDPFVLADGDRYYAYATTDVAQNLQLARSDDLVTWEFLDDPLPRLPGWSSGDTWAPEVLKTSAGYVLYYTARDPELKRPDSSGSQCITLALSTSPEGPFVDSSAEPLVCQAELGGSIDATAFVDVDGTIWLIWKNDGNCCGLPTRFFMQRLTADGLKLTGKVTDLGVVNDEPWEGGLIEAPTLAVRDGTYYLLYSANGYDTEFYAVGYATAKNVTGPYVDAPENPILMSPAEAAGAPRARGPGHQSIVEDDDGELWLAYHAWDQDAVGYGNFGRRAVWIDRLTLSGGKATVAGPMGDPQPVP